MPRHLALAALALAAAPSALAQDVPASASLPDTVVVTASREAEDLRRTGRAVTVVTAEQIARMPAASLDEVLRTAAGVEVQARGPLGAQADVTVRGSTFGGVLLLLDGVRANDPQTGHFLSDFPIPLAEIARIEVLRGPAAALYGPDAVGGVVHVVTKTALGEDGTRLDAQLGSYDTRQSETAGRVSFGRLGFGLAATSQRTAGEPVESVTPGKGAMGLNASLDRRAATLAVRFAGRRGAAFVRGAQDVRDYASIRHYSASALDSAFSTATTTWGQAGYAGALSPRLGVEASAGLRQHESTYRFNGVTPANAHDTRTVNALAALRLAAAPGVSLALGASAEHRRIESNNMGTHAAATAGAFAHARLARGPLSLALAARLDADPEGFGTEATPQASAAYTADRFTVRAAAGRAVRAPSFTDLYYNTQVANIRGRDVGNPALAAERAWNAEAGLDLAPARGLRLSATGFWRRTDNLIDFVKVTAADTVFRAQNLLEVTARGVEAEAVWRRGPLAASLGYTFLDLDRDASAVYASKYALLSARHLVQANASYAFEAGALRGLTVGVQSWGRDPLDNPPPATPTAAPNPRTDRPYAVHNLRAAYRLPVYPLTVTAELRNATDTRYVELFAPVMGRWWLVGIRLGD